MSWRQRAWLMPGCEQLSLSSAVASSACTTCPQPSSAVSRDAAASLWAALSTAGARQP